MQSKTFTVVMAIVTVIFATLAGIRIAQNDLSSIFGAPARKIGEVLYPDFDFKKDVHNIVISNSTGGKAVFLNKDGVWLMQSPFRDRADYRDLQRIVYFSRHLRVEDVMRRKDTTLKEAGMLATEGQGGRFHITLKDRKGNILADYRLGRRTAWHRLDRNTGTQSETFFVRPNKKSQKEHIYVCSAPNEIRPSVRQILDRGIDRLRDHRPFLFDPEGLADLTIRHRGGGEILLSRAKPDRPWRMTKPLQSRTKPQTMAGLLKGLYLLEAVQVHDRKSVTIPPRPKGGFYLEIEILRFDERGIRQPRPSRMTVEPPTTADADTVYATMDDRPGVVFEIPFKPVKGRITLGQLPLAVELLRGRTLASLDIRALRSITIHHLTQPDPIEIILGQGSLSGDRRWMINLNGDLAPANEIALGALLHAVSHDEVVKYASDAASNLRAFGLAPPHKRLVLRGGEGETIDLFFGRGDDGKFYAMRRGSSTVAEVDGGTFTAIAAQPHNWRDTLLMPFSIVDLAVMKIEPRIRVPLVDHALTLNYSFLDESWTARQFDEDVTDSLDTQSANQFIRFMESLRVDKWLGDTFPPAERSLQSPIFRFTAIFRQVDSSGNRVGVREVSFELAPASRSSQNRFYYGRLSGDPHFFVLGVETYLQLVRPLVNQH
ncbi:MAG: DUF4340 domain-containing protein [Roseibacillus sp.]